MGHIKDTRSLKGRTNRGESPCKINGLQQKLNNRVFETNKPQPVKSVKNTNKGT